MPSSFHSRPEGASYCNLTEERTPDKSDNESGRQGFGVSFRKTGRMIMCDFRKWQMYKWVTVCCCILCILCFIILVAVLSVSFRKESCTCNDDLKTRLEEIRSAVKENRKLIDTANTRMSSDCLYHQTMFNESVYNVTQLECGGSVQVPHDGSSIILDYKSKGMYDNNENCLWILDTAIENVRYAVRLKVTMKCEGFGDPEDTLAILDWDNYRFLTPFELRKMETTFIPASNWLYLSFSTNNAVNGNGFIIQIEAATPEKDFIGGNWVFNSSPGTFSHNNKREVDRIAVVIHPNSSALFNGLTMWQLNATQENTSRQADSCGEFDTLHIFSVGLKGKTTTLATLCGKSSAVVYSKDPIWVGYIGSNNTQGTGFTLSWSNGTL